MLRQHQIAKNSTKNSLNADVLKGDRIWPNSRVSIPTYLSKKCVKRSRPRDEREATFTGRKPMPWKLLESPPLCPVE